MNELMDLPRYRLEPHSINTTTLRFLFINEESRSRSGLVDSIHFLYLVEEELRVGVVVCLSFAEHWLAHQPITHKLNQTTQLSSSPPTAQSNSSISFNFVDEMRVCGLPSPKEINQFY